MEERTGGGSRRSYGSKAVGSAPHSRLYFKRKTASAVETIEKGSALAVERNIFLHVLSKKQNPCTRSSEAPSCVVYMM
jgi:hypothetical protein